MLVGGFDVADYSETLNDYFTSVAFGPDLIGESGHDYALPASGAVPEPSTCAIMLVGRGLLGGAMRRRLVVHRL